MAEADADDLLDAFSMCRVISCSHATPDVIPKIPVASIHCHDAESATVSQYRQNTGLSLYRMFSVLCHHSVIIQNSEAQFRNKIKIAPKTTPKIAPKTVHFL